MMTNATTEQFWLLMTLGMTALMWVPYILNRMAEQGVLPALWDPQGDTVAKAAWANRMMSAHLNAVENLAVFAPLVLLVIVYDAADQATAIAVQMYFFARLAHYLVFSLAIPVLRVVSFLAGFAAQMILLVSLLG